MKASSCFAALALVLAACESNPPSQVAETSGGQQSDVSVSAPDAVETASADAAPADSGATVDAATDAVKDASSDTPQLDLTTTETASADAQADAQAETQADTQTTADAAATCPTGSFLPMNEGVCKQASCANMGAAVQGALAAAVAKAEAGCAADGDCTLVPTSTACGGTCGVAVRKDAAEEMSKVVAWLDANICKPQGYGGKCGYATPGCMAPKVGCAGGKCVYSKETAVKCALPQPPNTECTGTVWTCKDGYFKGYGSTDCVEATCENLTKAKNDAIQGAIAKSQACSGSDDCVHIATSTDCGGTCGASVNSGMQNDVLKVVGWVDDNLCKPFGFKAKCGYSTPKCMAPAPTCGKGMCWMTATGP